MIRIDEIRIVGYKNIENAAIKLSNFNVVIGPNNSGKSNFIQTISFLNYVVNSSLDEAELSFTNGFDGTYLREIAPSLKLSEAAASINGPARQGVTSFELTFSNSETNRTFVYFLELEWESTFLKSKYKIKLEKLDIKESNKPGPATNIFSRNYESVKYGSEFSKTNIIEKVPNHFSVVRVLKIITEVRPEYKDAVDSFNEIIKTPIFYFSNVELLKGDKERLNSFNGRIISFELEKEIIALERGKNWNIFKEAIHNILSIEDVSVFESGGQLNLNEKIPITKYLFFTHHGYVKTLSQFSDGTLLIMALVTKILSTKNSLFLIEEPENSTHPRALIDLIAFIKSFSENTQFIITSHSIAVLNKTSVEDIIVSSVKDSGFCELFNVTSKKELKTRLKKSRVNFSDELFFAIEDTSEFE